MAALLAGCSADSNRLSDPFSNPFATSSNEPVHHLASRGAIPAGRTPPVVAQALPSSSVVASAAPLRPQLTSRHYAAPVSGETTGSIEPGPVRSARGAAYGGWTSSGGVPITVGQGETVDILSKRYGVPPTALLQTNGLTAGELRPGTNLVIPVYNAVAAAPQAAAPRPVAQAEPAPAPVETHAAKPAKLAKASLLKPRPERMAAAEERRAAPAKVVPAKPAPAPAKVAAKAERPAEKVAEAKPAHVRPIAKADKPTEMKTAKAVEDKPRKEAKVAAEAPAPAPVKAKAEKVAKLDKPAPVKAAPLKTAAAEAAPAPAAEAPTPAKADPAPTASVAPASNTTVADASGAPEFRWPARGHIIQGFKGGNDGINIALPDGTPVKAAENGTVAYAGSELKGYGNLVLIRHPNGYVTAYANNGEIDVKRGDQVKRGQTIAKSGQSGNVSSPQLHFELRKGSTPVDPTSYLAGL